MLGPLAVAQCLFQGLGAGIACGPGPKGPGENASYLALTMLTIARFCLVVP